MKLGGIATIAVLLFAACSPGSSDNASPDNPTKSADSCPTAHYDSVQFVMQAEYEQALVRLGDALELCADSEHKFYQLLGFVADIGSLAPERCSTALELYDLVEPSQSIEFLRHAARLHHVCSTNSLRERHLSMLVDALAEETYGVSASDMKEYVWHSQEAQLRFWVGDKQLANSLKNAIQELCADDDMLSLVIDLMAKKPVGPSNPGATLGLWTIQPAESIDAVSRQCLLRIADEIERRSHGFEPERANGAEQLVAGIRRIAL